MLELNWLDWVILAVIIISGLISLMRGLVKESLSFVGWVLAFWIALNFSKPLSAHLTSWITNSETRFIISFALLFIATLFILGIVNLIIASFMQKTGLSGTDRLLGMLFGLVRGALIITLALLLLRLTPIPNEPWWQHAKLIPYFSPLESWLQTLLSHFEWEALISPTPLTEEFAISKNLNQS